MFEIDKKQFGHFLCAQRKAKGYTQKELAEKLFLSDKAVSKWERGLSLPDITLLIPLAGLLDISVTELLEGKLLESTETLDTARIESLVQKALSYPEKLPQQLQKKKKLRLTFGLCILSVLLEWAVCMWDAGNLLAPFLNMTLLIQLLGLSFGAHFFLFAKERLPAYYDIYPIHAYHDGIFEMNLPGIRFTNRNWPYILRACRIWCLISTMIVPILCLCLCFYTRQFLPDFWTDLLIPGIISVFDIAVFFVPVYLAARKHT